MSVSRRKFSKEFKAKVVFQLKYGTIKPSEYIVELNNLYDAKITQELHRTQLILAKANYKVLKGE